jgi:hypothetical protein
VLHKEKPHDSCTSQLIIDVIKSDIIRLAGNIAHMGRNEEFIRGFSNPKLIENLGDVGIDRRIILMCILTNAVKCEDVDLKRLPFWRDPMTNSCEHCNESSGFLTEREFIDKIFKCL